MRGLICILAMLWASGAAAQPKEAVLVDDAARLEWQAIGRVNVGGYRSRSLCTGTLIAPQVLLTAAHCVVDPSTGEPFRAGRVVFVAGWHKGTHQGAAKAASIEVSAGFLEAFRRNNVSRDAITQDRATLRLESPLPGITPLPVAQDQLAQDGPVSILGYRHDRPQALSQYLNCNAQLTPQQPIRLDCAVVAGTSGAPVLQRDMDGAWHVVGVVSAAGGEGGLAAQVSAELD